MTELECIRLLIEDQTFLERYNGNAGNRCDGGMKSRMPLYMEHNPSFQQPLVQLYIISKNYGYRYCIKTDDPIFNEVVNQRVCSILDRIDAKMRANLDRSVVYSMFDATSVIFRYLYPDVLKRLFNVYKLLDDQPDNIGAKQLYAEHIRVAEQALIDFENGNLQGVPDLASENDKLVVKQFALMTNTYFNTENFDLDDFDPRAQNMFIFYLPFVAGKVKNIKQLHRDYLNIYALTQASVIGTAEELIYWQIDNFAGNFTHILTDETKKAIEKIYDTPSFFKLWCECDFSHYNVDGFISAFYSDEFKMKMKLTA
jgi:hypothetical protein